MSLSLANPHPEGMNTAQKAALALAALGLLALLVTWAAGQSWMPAVSMPLALVLLGAGALWYTRASYAGLPAGVKNTGTGTASGTCS